MVSTMCLIFLPPDAALADMSSDRSEGTGIEVASWSLTVPYIIGKGTFALGGAVVGGLGYVFSGGNVQYRQGGLDQKHLWDLYHSPRAFEGRRSVHFLGQPDESPMDLPPAPPTSQMPYSTPK